MMIYLAGGVSGNLRPLFMKIHLATASSDSRLSELLYLAGEHPIKNGNDMKLYLAGENGKTNICSKYIYNSTIKIGDLNILETYYYLRKNEGMTKLIPYFNSFLLDSGAFTFMSGSHKCEIDWDSYVDEYAQFINRYDIKLFFELDIDSIVGLAEVERLRDKLQAKTGKHPIPVWHKNRGKDYFIGMCKNYPYVAIGGIVTEEIKRSTYEKLFQWFINTAHKYGAKIHGLGYTSVEKLKLFHFDSVDSTAWLYGNRGGWVDKFDISSAKMVKIQKKGCLLKSKEAAINNFLQWAKFSKYAERYY